MIPDSYVYLVGGLITLVALACLCLRFQRKINSANYMEVYAFRFNARDLRKIPEQYRGFLIASAHCFNELLSSSLFTILEQKASGLSEAEGSFVTIRQMTILRSQISRIIEYHDLVVGQFASIKLSDHDFFEEIIEKFKPLSQAVNGASWARKLRNNMSFHYDANYASKSLTDFDDDAPFNMILGEVVSVTAFNFAEEILSTPVFKAAGDGDLAVGIDRATGFAIDVHALIMSFHTWLLICLFDKYQIDKRIESAPFRLELCADEDSDRLPLLFMKREKYDKT